MGSKVGVKFTGKPEELLSAQSKVIRNQDLMIAKLRKGRQESKKAGKANKAAFDPGIVKKFAGSIAGVATGVGAMLAAQRLITGEIDKQIRLAEKQAQAAITLSSARQDVIRNLAGADEGVIQNVLKSGTAIAGDTGVDEKFIAQALASAVSASGGDAPAAISAVRQSAKFLADKPSAISGFAGSLLDLSKVTGTTDARTNQGLLSKVGALSRVVDPQSQAQNIPRSLIGQTAFGSTTEGAASLFAAISTGSGDIRGATSGTAAIALARQLEEFDLKNESFKGSTTTDRIRSLQASPDLSKAFLEKASFEQIALGPIRQLLSDPRSDIAKQFTSNLEGFPVISELGGIADQSIANRDLDELEGAAKLDRTLAVQNQQGLTSDTKGVRRGVIQKRFSEALTNAGTGVIAQPALELAFNLRTARGAEPAEVAEGLLRQEAKDRSNALFGSGSDQTKAATEMLLKAAETMAEAAKKWDETQEKARATAEKNAAAAEKLEAAANGTVGLGAPPIMLDTQGGEL